MNEVETLGLIKFVVVEIPNAHEKRAREIDTQDLVSLAFAAGRFAGRFEPRAQVKGILPARWKGQIKKPISHYRVWRELRMEERSLFSSDTEERIIRGLNGGPYKWFGHNTLDATGIGLHHSGRLLK